LTKLNKSLEKELDGVFHAYLLFSNSSRELIKQAKKFAGLIAFNDESIDAHPDIKIVESDNLRTLGVEDIRTVITQDNLSPIEGRYKVVIFPPLKSLTEEASNALLKTIEEPSKTSVFLILSTGNFWSHSRDDSNNMILSTIKSRCRTIFVDTEKDIKFNYSDEDFIDFLDFEIVDEKQSFKKILDILTIQKKELSNLIHSFALVNECKKVIDDLDDNVSLTLNSLIVSCLEYLTNSIIIQQNISRDMYEFAVKVEIAMADISSGMRPQVVLSNLSLEV
jgi:DNA polymerase III delta prime subunit